jgi:LysR family glycine cleavage system transcriptional activator
VRIVASRRATDVDRDRVFAAIRFGPRADPAHFSETLIRDRMTPPCAPSLAARLRRPPDIPAAPLIHDDRMASLGWSPTRGDSLDAAGVERPDCRRGARFPSADHALAAAAEGGAAAFRRVSLAVAERRQGRLVAPFDLAVDSAAHCRFVCPRGAEACPAMAALRAWFAAEAADAAAAFPPQTVASIPRLAAADRVV